ncbi:MAG: DUF3052 domain-containing protein [Acidobacteria bacterium]|nr:DUF3052 domain-containing protein [Acidobacteriota bacterium]
MAGYSGTPLVQKIGIKEGHSVALVNAPAGFDEELRPLPKGVKLNGARGLVDVIICFVADRTALEKSFRQLPPRMTSNGMLWLAWPKKASGVATDLSENTVRDCGIAAGLVDIKVCAVNDVWSGLKFVIPVAKRAAGAKLVESKAANK